jgi:hypothetical protein
MLQHFFRAMLATIGIERASIPPGSLGISAAARTRVESADGEFPANAPKFYIEVHQCLSPGF